MTAVSNVLQIAHHPQLVICVPCFNEERWLKKTLESVRAQTMTDFAVFISDNGSTDGTARIAEDFAAQDPRFHVYSHASNIGAAANFNFARDATDSPFLMWLGAHDLIESTYLERVLPPLIADRRISLCYAYSRMIDEDGETIRAEDGSEIDYPAVTGERKLARFPSKPVLRYLHVVRCGDFCIPINNVIRRTALEGVSFQHVRGCDAVVLSHLGYHGPFFCVEESLYLHRIFKRRDQSYMARITGEEGVRSDWQDFMELSIRQFSKNVGKNPLKPLYISMIRTMFKYYHTDNAPGLLPAIMRSLGAFKARFFYRRGSKQATGEGVGRMLPGQTLVPSVGQQRQTQDRPEGEE